ncbi:MAG: hypothetical protein ACK55Z_20435, partial [bacterium]
MKPHTLVPGPMDTPSSTRALSWTKAWGWIVILQVFARISWGDPWISILPSSSRITRSQRSTVLSRWAISTIVSSRLSPSIAAITLCSVAVSSALVASS